jgi:hypothetical protein
MHGGREVAKDFDGVGSRGEGAAEVGEDVCVLVEQAEEAFLIHVTVEMIERVRIGCGTDHVVNNLLGEGDWRWAGSGGGGAEGGH